MAYRPDIVAALRAAHDVRLHDIRSGPACGADVAGEEATSALSIGLLPRVHQHARHLRRAARKTCIRPLSCLSVYVQVVLLQLPLVLEHDPRQALVAVVLVLRVQVRRIAVLLQRRFCLECGAANKATRHTRERKLTLWTTRGACKPRTSRDESFQIAHFSVIRFGDLSASPTAALLQLLV